MEQGDGQLVSTAIAGLDQLLDGGVPRHGIYVIQGGIGTGKTTASLQLLRGGAQRGERCLFLCLSQSQESVEDSAKSLGWSLDGIILHQLSRRREREHLESRQVVFDRIELELDELMGELLGVVEEHRPDLVALDAVSHLRLLTDDDLTYRSQLLTIRDFFAARNATLILTNNMDLAPGSGEVGDISSGVIELRRETSSFGIERRTVEIIKIRGRQYRSGRHDLTLTSSGVEVAPRLSAVAAQSAVEQELISSGDENLDCLLGGGLLTGTSALIAGASGTGKSSVATLYATEAAKHHGGSLVYLFDETLKTFLTRSESLSMPVKALLQEDKLRIRHVPTATLSPGGFGQQIRSDLDETGARVVVIDSLTGYLNAMTDAKMLETQMHDLLMYLNDRNVLNILVVAQHGLFGNALSDPIDVSYMADSVILMRHFEYQGELRRAISVFKKRYGDHENRIRELMLSGKVTAGEPLVNFVDVLSGTPRLFASGKSKET